MRLSASPNFPRSTQKGGRKGKIEDMAKADKARYEREMINLHPPQRGVQGPQCNQEASFGLLPVLFGVPPQIRERHRRCCKESRRDVEQHSCR